MPSVASKQMMVAYAATVLAQAELPSSLDDLFPDRQGPLGQKPVGGKVRRRVMDALMRTGLARERRVNGEVMYESAGFQIWEVSLSEDDLPEAAEYFGWSVGEMRRMRYSARDEERQAKLRVAARALKKLCASTGPVPRSALFTPAKGNKFEGRAAWTPTWQGPFLEAAVKSGAVRATGESPPAYEAVDRALLERIYTGEEHGKNCLVTLIWPNSPCTDDGSAGHVHSRENNMTVVDASADPVPASEEAPVAPEGQPSEPDPPVPPLAELARQVPPEEQGHAVMELMTKVLEATLSHGKTHKIILDSFTAFIEKYGAVLKGIDALGSRLDAVNASLGGLRKDVGKASEELSSLGGTMGSVKKRLSDLEKAVGDQRRDAEAHHKSIKQGVAEVATAFAGSEARHSPDALLQAIQGLRADVAKLSRAQDRAGMTAVLKRLQGAIDDVSAVRDLALDAIPGRPQS